MTDDISRWGRPGFEKQIGEIRNHRDLASATAGLSMGTRQRIYAFIKRGGSFKRGTWDGCVMNAASGDGNVSSITAAANYFHEPYHAIANFIGCWDATRYMNERDANRKLEGILLDCGITGVSPLPVENEKVKVYRVRLFTSAETAAVEELRAEIEAGAFDADLASFRELVGV